MADKIRVGVIGLGRISSLHLPAYKNKGLNAELVAICDKNKSKVQEVKKEYGVEKTFTEYTDLLKDNTIDAVEILTPHHLHAEMTIKAAEAGKHISLQKVPAMRLSQMDAMAAAAKKAKVRYRVFENFRFYEPYIFAYGLIKQGVIGTVERVDYNMVGGISSIESWNYPLSALAWRMTERDNYRSSTVFDDGYHKHSIMAKFLDNEIDSILAWQGGYRFKGTLKLDLPCVVIYSCKNKARYGTWNTSMQDYYPGRSKYYGCDEWVEIFGSKGAIWIPGCTGNWFDPKYCNGDVPLKAGVHWIGKGDNQWHSKTDLDTDWATSFLNCSRAFIEGIRTGAEIDLTPKDARYILSIDLAIIRSVRHNFQEVKLKDVIDGPEMNAVEAEKYAKEDELAENEKNNAQN